MITRSQTFQSRKSDMMLSLDKMLNEQMKTKGRERKIVLFYRIYDFLIVHKWFVDTNLGFKRVVLEKLDELEKDGLPKYKITYYRKILQ